MAGVELLAEQAADMIMKRTQSEPRLAYQVVSVGQSIAAARASADVEANAAQAEEPAHFGVVTEPRGALPPTEPALPVLLVMGYGMPGLMWEAQVQGLSKQRTVVYYDHRGIGESDPIMGPFKMGDLAADALRLMDELGFRAAHIVGVSMGGMVAQHLALMAPERLASLSLIATHAGGPLAALPTLEGLKLFAQANLGPASERPRTLLKLLYPPEYRSRVRLDLLSERIQKNLARRAAPKTLRGQFRAILGHDTRSRLSQIRTPTLVVQPEQDLLVRPEHNLRLAAQIPGARLLSLPDAGHGCAFQSALRINRALLAHFERAEAGSR